MARTSSANPMDRLVERLSRLPGIGKRSAERLAFYLLKEPSEECSRLAQAIVDLKRHTKQCSTCFNLTDADPCSICCDPRRDQAIVLVVEQPNDVVSIEQTGLYKGVYHVLMGRIAPLDGVGPGDLTVEALLDRVRAGSAKPQAVTGDQGSGEIQSPIPEPQSPNPDRRTPNPEPRTPLIHEVIIGTNPSLEGDGTALYLTRELDRLGVKVTRLGRGLPYGSQMQLVSKAVLADALQGRQRVP